MDHITTNSSAATPTSNDRLETILRNLPEDSLLALANGPYMMAIRDKTQLGQSDVWMQLRQSILTRPAPLKATLKEHNKVLSKALCGLLGLPVSGTKVELLTRLAEAIDSIVSDAVRQADELHAAPEPDQRTKLELRWPHKDGMLLYEFDRDNKPIPKFVRRREVEPRPLIEIGQFGDERGSVYHAERSNLLIQGDNLRALRALAPDFAGKVKLIYIDPPFRTGNAFEHYDDSLEHSIWLTMMRDRLQHLRNLLSDDGAIFVHIDDHENAYLKVLLDETFGRRNFITTIVVKKSATTGHKAINPTPVNVNEFVHGYARDRNQWQYRRLQVPREDYDWMYSKVITNIDAPPEHWQFINLSDATARSLGFESAKCVRSKLWQIAGDAAEVFGGSSRDAYRKLNDYFKQQQVNYALDNSDRVIRFARVNYEGVSQEAQDLIDRSVSEGGRIYHLEREEYLDMYIAGQDRILWLSDKLAEVDGEKKLVEPLTNIWDDISWQGIANEGDVVMRKGKKPEALIQRIIEISTREGDLVLDSFAGSGTTGAVAHKMRRRWIMIEMGEHAESLCIHRLKRVVSGEDDTGISGSVDWGGGGGFRYCVLGDPLLIEDKELGTHVINPNYTNGPLVRAVCVHEGFALTGKPVLHGRNGATYAHVTEEYISSAYVAEVAKCVDQAEKLIVFGLRVSSGIETPSNVEVRKIPRDLTRRYSS